MESIPLCCTAHDICIFPLNAIGVHIFVQWITAVGLNLSMMMHWYSVHSNIHKILTSYTPVSNILNAQTSAILDFGCTHPKKEMIHSRSSCSVGLCMIIQPALQQESKCVIFSPGYQGTNIQESWSNNLKIMQCENMIMLCNVKTYAILYGN